MQSVMQELSQVLQFSPHFTECCAKSCIQRWLKSRVTQTHCEVCRLSLKVLKMRIKVEKKKRKTYAWEFQLNNTEFTLCYIHGQSLCHSVSMLMLNTHIKYSANYINTSLWNVCSYSAWEARRRTNIFREQKKEAMVVKSPGAERQPGSSAALTPPLF